MRHKRHDINNTASAEVRAAEKTSTSITSDGLMAHSGSVA